MLDLTGVRIGLVRPRTEGPEDGNRRTAGRWATLFASLGAEVTQGAELGNPAPDVLVALHALKSYAAIRAFRTAFPGRPLVLCLTGTDLYGAHTGADADRWADSLACADRLVVLQERALERLPTRDRAKARVIHQSLDVSVQAPEPPTDSFRVAFLANVRAVKDPLTAVRACELLPPDTSLRVVHAGSVIEPELGRRFEERAARVASFETRGSLPYADALGLLASSHLALSTSREEGGANALSEAIVLGTPVLASTADGNLGILGDEYPGTFPVGDAEGLAALLQRCERDAAFVTRLREACALRAPLFRPERERAAWTELLGELLDPGGPRA